MAEFCLECWNRINQTDYPRWKYEISWDKDLCEGCGEWKRVVVMERSCWMDEKHPLPKRQILRYNKKKRRR